MRHALALAVLVAAAAPAAAQVADRPEVRVGDRWRFVQWYTVPSREPTLDWVVTAVTDDRIEATENGEPLRLTRELGVIESPRAREGNAQPLRFPLEVGKRWRYETDWLFKPKGSSGTMSVAVEVVGYEKVRVPAGEFDAFKLALVRRIDGASTFGSVIAGESGSTYWYAPAARAIVRSENRNPYLGPSTIELVDFRRAP